jgi:hypothetical protein
MSHPPYRVMVERSTGGGLKRARPVGSRSPEERHLLTVFVHGFNTDELKALKRWDEQIWPGVDKLLNRQTSDVMLFFWPSYAKSFMVFSPVLYPRVVPVAISAGVELGKYLTDIAERNSRLRVQFVGYSLGCRVVLSAVKQLSEERKVRVVRVLLMGAAVPEGDCTSDGQWPDKVSDLFGAAQGQEVSRNSDVILHSRDDQVLGKTFRFGERRARKRGLESTGSLEAVGLKGGPRTSPARWTQKVELCIKHEAYLRDKHALQHVAALFGTLLDRQLEELPECKRFLDEQQPDQRQLASVPPLG